MFLAAAPAMAAEAPGWSYDNDYTGQEEWGLIDKAYAACSIGTQQSPIHISRTEMAALPDLKFTYKKAAATVQNIGYTPEITFPKHEPLLEENGERFVLQSIQFHTPSEHTVKEKFYALEIHLLHRDVRGNLLIVAVLVNMETALAGFDRVLSSVSKTPGEKRSLTFDPSVFLPVYRGYYAYDGSLTHPPCTEGVKWRVLKSAISVSKEQLIALSDITGRNARLTQPVYMRTVKESKDKL